MAESDDEIRKLFDDITEVPFSEALQQRISDRARCPATTRGRRTFSVKSAFAAASGFVAACVLSYGVWNYSDPARSVAPSGSAHTPHPQLHALPQVSAVQPMGFGLQAAPISIGDIWVGSPDKQTPKTTVFATLTNVGTAPMDPYRVVGVLSFQRRPMENLLRGTDWIAFVDPPKTRLAPGDSTTWSFRPVGAPHTADGTLTERPRLAFFTSGAVPEAKADTFWKSPVMRVANVEVQPRTQWGGSQSIEVRASLTNLDKRPIPLRNLLALIWFGPNRTPDWTQPGIIRFMDQVQTVRPGITSVAPNQSVQIYFRLIGSERTNFLGLVPQVAMIEP